MNEGQLPALWRGEAAEADAGNEKDGLKVSCLGLGIFSGQNDPSSTAVPFLKIYFNFINWWLWS